VRRSKSAIPLGHCYRASMPKQNPENATVEAFGTAVSETGMTLPEVIQSLLLRDWALDID